MFNWQKMCANTAGYSGLHEELKNCRGRYILEGVKMPSDCYIVKEIHLPKDQRERKCTIEFIYDGNNITVNCYPHVYYHGCDRTIYEWFLSGSITFNNFEELDSFLIRFNIPPKQGDLPCAGSFPRSFID